MLQVLEIQHPHFQLGLFKIFQRQQDDLPQRGERFLNVCEFPAHLFRVRENQAGYFLIQLFQLLPDFLIPGFPTGLNDIQTPDTRHAAETCFQLFRGNCFPACP